MKSKGFAALTIVLISDGSPNEGIDSSQNFVQNNVLRLNNDACLFTTSQNPCITVYTLGVDNANQRALQSISGNTLSQNPEEYNYAQSMLIKCKLHLMQL